MLLLDKNNDVESRAKGERWGEAREPSEAIGIEDYSNAWFPTKGSKYNESRLVAEVFK